MKRPVAFLVLTGLLALPLAVTAMTNKDIIKMHKAGLSEETILAAMEKEKPDYDTGTDALIELKSAGVSERVIQAMLRLESGSSSSSADSSSSSSASSSSSSSSASSSSSSSGGSGAPFWQDFPSIAPPKAEVTVGKDYFTRYSFREEKGSTRRRTTAADPSCRSTRRSSWSRFRATR